MILLPLGIKMPVPVVAVENVAGAGSKAAAVSPSGSCAHESGFGSRPLSRNKGVVTASDFARGDLMVYAVQMVTPLRREFGRGLDVTHFLYNAKYANEIIALGLTSKDARLRGYATFMQLQMFGA